jgi:hypothetical protein
VKTHLVVVQKIIQFMLKAAAESTPILVQGLNILFLCLTVFFLGSALNLAIFHVPSDEGGVIVQLGDLLFFNTSSIANLFDLIETAYLFAAVLTLFLKDLKWVYRLFFFVLICAYPLLMTFLFMLRTEPSA